MTNGEVLPSPIPAFRETAQRGEEAFRIDQRIRQTVRQMRQGWVSLARDLCDVQDRRLYELLGHPTFESYLADPGLELGRRWVFELTAIYRQLVIVRGVEPARLEQLEVGKVREVAPAIRRGQVTVDTALADAGALGRRDLETRYRGLASATPGAPDVDSRVRTEAEPEVRLCPTCGRRMP